MDLNGMAQVFSGKKDYRKHKKIQFYQETYKCSLAFLGSGVVQSLA